MVLDLIPSFCVCVCVFAEVPKSAKGGQMPCSLLFFFVFVKVIYLIYACVHQGILVEARGQLGSQFPLPCSSRGSTQVTRLSDKCLYPLSCYADTCIYNSTDICRLQTERLKILLPGASDYLLHFRKFLVFMFWRIIVIYLIIHEGGQLFTYSGAVSI